VKKIFLWLGQPRTAWQLNTMALSVALSAVIILVDERLTALERAQSVAPTTYEEYKAVATPPVLDHEALAARAAGETNGASITGLRPPSPASSAVRPQGATIGRPEAQEGT